MKPKILKEIKYQTPHKFIVPKHAPQKTESEGEEEEKEESSSSPDDNKSPFSSPPSFNYIPPSSSRFANTTPSVEFPAFSKPVPPFGISSY